MLSGKFVVYSTYGDRLAKGDSFLVKHNMDVRLDIVHVDAKGSLIVADITVKCGSFRFLRPTNRRSVLIQLGHFLEP